MIESLYDADLVVWLYDVDVDIEGGVDGDVNGKLVHEVDVRIDTDAFVEVSFDENTKY